MGKLLSCWATISFTIGFSNGYHATKPSGSIPQSASLWNQEKACTAFYVVQANSAKFCLHAGNMKFSTQREQ
jgi:hypothetical protein